MSGYIPRVHGKDVENVDVDGVLKRIPMKIYHGTHDEVVQFSFGKLSYEYLKDKLGLTDVEFAPIEGLGHSVRNSLQILFF